MNTARCWGKPLAAFRLRQLLAGGVLYLYEIRIEANDEIRIRGKIQSLNMKFLSGIFLIAILFCSCRTGMEIIPAHVSEFYGEGERASVKALVSMPDTETVSTQITAVAEMEVRNKFTKATEEKPITKKVADVATKIIPYGDVPAPARDTPEDTGDTALLLSVLALIGLFCGYGMIYSPGGWIYVGIIFFVATPAFAVGAVIAAIITFDKSKSHPKDHRSARTMAKIGFVAGILLFYLFVKFLQDNPHFFG